MTWLAHASTPFLSSLLDVIVPLENNSSRHIWNIHVDYLIFDRESYFYAVSIHASCVFFNLVAFQIGADIVFIIGVEHSCGLLDVVR